MVEYSTSASKVIIVTILINTYVVSGLPNKYTSRSETSFPLVTRDEWGALPPLNQRPFHLPVPYVVIHHTYLPPACTTREQCAEDMRSMQKFHNAMKWGDIGYNFCVGNDGEVFEGRGWQNIGVHAERANSVSIGICLIGDWRRETPPPAMLASTKALITSGVELGVISPTYKLVGHKQILPTECPGTALMNEISTWEHFSSEFNL